MALIFPPHDDVDSVISYESSFFDEHHEAADAVTTSTTSFDTPPPKALFFNPAIPVSYRKHHLRLYSDDGSFSTVLKEDELCTVKEVLDLLRKKYEFTDIILVLKDEEKGTKRALQENERIVKIQNRLFREMWIEEDQLPSAALKYQHSFKFLIHKF